MFTLYVFDISSYFIHINTFKKKFQNFHKQIFLQGTALQMENNEEQHDSLIDFSSNIFFLVFFFVKKDNH